jgi:hypothetical protein
MKSKKLTVPLGVIRRASLVFRGCVTWRSVKGAGHATAFLDRERDLL